MRNDDAWIQTVSGQRFPLTDIDPHAIEIDDIAHGLSMLCRFNGQCLKFYSVAEHCVHVSRIVPPDFAFDALMHDAGEAYLGDVPSPLKAHLPDFKEQEYALNIALSKKFGLRIPEPPEVKQADMRMLLAERTVLMAPPPETWPIDSEGVVPADTGMIECWAPEEAKRRFLMRFRELVAQRQTHESRSP